MAALSRPIEVLAVLLAHIQPGFERASEHRVRRHTHPDNVGAEGAGQCKIAPRRQVSYVGR
jgi:hypothetical protein